MTHPIEQALAAAGVEAKALKVKCVNAHDRCDGGPCPYCEPEWPLRYENGRFAALATTTEGEGT